MTSGCACLGQPFGEFLLLLALLGWPDSCLSHPAPPPYWVPGNGAHPFLFQILSESHGAGFKLHEEGGFRARRTWRYERKRKKCAAWQPHAWHSSQPVTPPPPIIFTLSPVPSVTSVVTPRLDSSQEAGYSESAYSLPEASPGGTACGRQPSHSSGALSQSSVSLSCKNGQ